MISRSLIFVILSTMVAVTNAQEYNLEFKPVAGEKLIYGLTFDIEGLGQTFIYKATITNEVVERKEDGQYIIASYQSDHSLTADGETQPVASETVTAVTTYAKDGRPIKIGGDESTPQSFRVANLTSFIASEKAIKLGEEWDVKIAADTEAGTVDVEHHYKLVRIEKVDGVDRAVIEFSTKETSGENPGTAKGTVIIDTNTGRQIKYEAAITNLPIGPNMVSGKIEIVLKAS